MKHFKIWSLLLVLFTVLLPIGLVSCNSNKDKSATEEAAPETPKEAADTSAVPEVEKANYVFTNGKVYTVNPSEEWAQAVAVTGNKISYVGDDKGAQAYVGPDTKSIDLGGKMMLPGFIESHMHPTVGAAMAQGLWLADMRNKDEAIAAIKEYVKANPDKEAILGFGWKTYWFDSDGPTKEELDAIESERPIYLFEISVHSAWVNSKALEVAGITKDTADTQPPFSYYKRTKEGLPSGWVVELPAQFEVINEIQPFTPEYVEAGLRDWLKEFSAAGLTSIFDPGYVFLQDQKIGYQLMKRIEDSGDLTVRIFQSFYANNPEADEIKSYTELKKASPETPLIKHNMLKINVDGVVESHSIYVLAPYKDKPDSYGSTIYNQEQLDRLVTEAVKRNINVHFHAMGDGSLSRLLTALENAKEAHPESTSRFSLAHTFLVDPKDHKRIKDIDLVTSYSGNFYTSDPNVLDIFGRILGEDRLEILAPMKSIHELGARTSLGTDWPASGDISTHKTLDNIQYVMTRQDLEGKTPVLAPAKETMDLEQALAAATINGAYTLGMENELGSIEVGKLADLIVLDKNLFDIPVKDIHKAKVVMTMMDGNVVHEEK